MMCSKDSSDTSQNRSSDGMDPGSWIMVHSGVCAWRPHQPAARWRRLLPSSGGLYAEHGARDTHWPPLHEALRAALRNRQLGPNKSQEHPKTLVSAFLMICTVMLCLLLDGIVVHDRTEEEREPKGLRRVCSAKERGPRPPRHRCLPIRILGSWLTTPRPCLCPMWTARDWARPPPWDLRFVIREFRPWGARSPIPASEPRAAWFQPFPNRQPSPPPSCPSESNLLPPANTQQEGKIMANGRGKRRVLLVVGAPQSPT